jgi:hypothetical protein
MLPIFPGLSMTRWRLRQRWDIGAKARSPRQRSECSSALRAWVFRSSAPPPAGPFYWDMDAAARRCTFLSLGQSRLNDLTPREREAFGLVARAPATSPATRQLAGTCVLFWPLSLSHNRRTHSRTPRTVPMIWSGVRQRMGNGIRDHTHSGGGGARGF